MLSNITVSPAPHISKGYTTRAIMLDVIIGLAPAMIVAVWFFRLHAVIVIASCVGACMITEWICNRLRAQPTSLFDLSAVVTGIILALSLPPLIPFWAAIIGGAFAIALAKMVFGGLGSNVFNPAMAGRAFLTASFGMLMTTWMVPAGIETQSTVVSPDNPTAVTQATPLAWSKQAIKDKAEPQVANEQLLPSFTGRIPGSLGETSALALILGGVYMLIRRTITYHIPAAVLLSAFAFAAVAWLLDRPDQVNPLLHLTTGGMLICAFFIATDPVTAPLTVRGSWIFGAGVGLLIMLIRVVGEYPEGVMFAVLIMNALTPLIDRFTKRVPLGGHVQNA